jgi:hypothetical protein
MVVGYQIIGHWLDAWDFVLGCEGKFAPYHYSQTGSGAHTAIFGIGAMTPFLIIYQPDYEADQL